MKTYEIVVRDKLAEAREARRMAQERSASIQRNILIVAVAAVAIIIAAVAGCAIQASAGRGVQAIQPTQTLVEWDAWDFAALFRAAEDPAEAQRIGEALEAQGYFSAAVPMSWEYQDYMRTYCHKYGCPYPLALAVAEVESNFDMDAVGMAGEVGIMQLNPGPGGSYHAEIEAATGLDPTTPEGNIAGGCYRLGEFLARYEDPAMAVMAYRMGRAGADRAVEAGTDPMEWAAADMEGLERWEAAVNAWAGE